MTQLTLGNFWLSIFTSHLTILQGTTKEKYILRFTEGNITSTGLRCPETSDYWTYTLMTYINQQEVEFKILLYINDILSSEIETNSNCTNEIILKENDVIKFEISYHGEPVADNDINIDITLYTIKG